MRAAVGRVRAFERDGGSLSLRGDVVDEICVEASASGATTTTTTTTARRKVMLLLRGAEVVLTRRARVGPRRLGRERAQIRVRMGLSRCVGPFTLVVFRDRITKEDRKSVV